MYVDYPLYYRQIVGILHMQSNYMKCVGMWQVLSATSASKIFAVYLKYKNVKKGKKCEVFYPILITKIVSMRWAKKGKICKEWPFFAYVIYGWYLIVMYLPCAFFLHEKKKFLFSILTCLDWGALGVESGSPSSYSSISSFKWLLNSSIPSAGMKIWKRE